MSHRERTQNDLDDLLNRIANGCHQSATQLYQRHQRAVYAYIRLRVGNDEAAEEILNDTFMAAFRKPLKYNASCEYRTWLIGIAKRLCSNWLRKQAAIRQVEAEPLNDILAETIPAETITALESMEDQELQGAIQICIDKLPDRQREAIYWHWHQELKLSDIATNMACTEGSVKTQLHHARQKIMNCLRQAFGLEAAYA